MSIFLYVMLYLLSLVIEFGIVAKKVFGMVNQLFDEGYMINSKYLKELLNKYKVKGNILDFIPGLNVLQFYFKFTRNMKKLRKDPALINNLQKVSTIDKSSIDDVYEDKDRRSLKEKIERAICIITLSENIEVRYEGIDLGTYTDEELKENNGFLSDEVLETISSIDEVHKNNEGKAIEQSFYVLPGEYSMSNVFRIDDGATFIKTFNGTNVAIVNATDDEVNEFLKKSLIVKPKFDVEYHIISIKPFDKNKVRKSLLEMEYAKMPIEGEMIEIKESEKKRTL